MTDRPSQHFRRHLHYGRWHCYHKRHNPAGCANPDCLSRYRPYHYYVTIFFRGWFR